MSFSKFLPSDYSAYPRIPTGIESSLSFWGSPSHLGIALTDNLSNWVRQYLHIISILLALLLHLGAIVNSLHTNPLNTCRYYVFPKLSLPWVKYALFLCLFLTGQFWVPSPCILVKLLWMNLRSSPQAPSLTISTTSPAISAAEDEKSWETSPKKYSFC